MTFLILILWLIATIIGLVKFYKWGYNDGYKVARKLYTSIPQTTQEDIPTLDRNKDKVF